MLFRLQNKFPFHIKQNSVRHDFRISKSSRGTKPTTTTTTTTAWLATLPPRTLQKYKKATGVDGAVRPFEKFRIIIQHHNGRSLAVRGYSLSWFRLEEEEEEEEEEDFFSRCDVIIWRVIGAYKKLCVGWCVTGFYVSTGRMYMYVAALL